MSSLTQAPKLLAAAAPPREAPQERAWTLRSVFTGLSLALIWTLAVCYLAVYISTYTYQFYMVLGFGALLTIFLLHYPRLYLTVLLGCWTGTAGLSWMDSTPEQKDLLAGGLLRSLPVLALLAIVGGMQLRRRLTKPEAALVYAMVAIAIPWSVSIKACVETSASNLFDYVRRQEKMVFQWAKDMPWWGPTVLAPDGQDEHEARVLAALAQSILRGNDAARDSLLRLPPTAFYYNDHRDVWDRLATLKPTKEAWQLSRYRPQIEKLDARTRWGRLRPASLIDLPLSGQDAAVAESMKVLADRAPQWASLDAAIRGFARGSPDGTVPWRLWWRPMLYWVAMCGSYAAMIFGLLLMFRRRWIEHERLPFPWALPVLAVLQDEQRTDRRRWIAWLIGFGICVPGITYASLQVGATAPIPMIPWAGPMGGQLGGFDLSSLGLLHKMPVYLYFGPFILAMFLLFPTDVLITIVLTHVLLYLLAGSILQSLGVNVGKDLVDSFRGWGIRSGGCAGLFIWGLYFHRKMIWNYLKSLVGAGSDARPDQRDELGRWLVAALFVVGLAGFVLLGLYATSGPMMVFLTLWVLIYVFAQVRQRADGMLFTYENNITSHQLVSVQRDVLHDHPTLVGSPQYPDAVATPNAWGSHWFAWGFAGQFKTYGPQNVLLEVFKIAHEVRANVRHIGLAILLVMVVVALLAPPLYLKLVYTYGFENTYQEGHSVYQSFTQWSERAISYGIHSTSRTYINPGAQNWFFQYQPLIWTVVGIAIVGVLTYMRREYVWFPLSPVGFVLAGEVINSRVGYVSAEWAWFAFLLAWVLKKLVFRWLGVRYWNERMLPVLLFLLLGMIFGMFVYILRYVAMGKGFLS